MWQKLTPGVCKIIAHALKQPRSLHYFKGLPVSLNLFLELYQTEVEALYNKEFDQGMQWYEAMTYKNSAETLSLFT